MTTVSLEKFNDQLAASGLMSADDLSAFTEDLPADQKPNDAETLAKLLVTANKLTPFQALQIWKGKAKHLVLGNYVISEKIGEGGMGMVFRASHKVLKREVALKVLSPTVIKDKNAVRRFLREVEAAAKLTHPNIVTALDANQAGGTYFLIMEYVEGRDLSVVVKKQGPARIEKAVDCILQAARGLEFAHQQGVIHRDIKPANLLMDKSGTIKVLDMGLARFEDSDDDAASQAGLTGTGTIMGTIDYMSPEQADDSKRAGPQADIYSLGASLYFLLVGKPMIEGKTLGKKLRVLLTGVGLPESICSVRSSVPAQLDAVFGKMTAFDMNDRYRSMTEVIADLEALTARGLTTSAPTSTSTAGITPLAAGQSNDSAMQSFLKNLTTSTATPEAAEFMPPKTADAPPETMANSVGDSTRPAIKRTPAIKKPNNRNLVIGIPIAVVLAIGAILWGLSGGGDDSSTDNRTDNNATKSLSDDGSISDVGLAFDGKSIVNIPALEVDLSKPFTIDAHLTLNENSRYRTLIQLGNLQVNNHSSGHWQLYSRPLQVNAHKTKTPFQQRTHLAVVSDGETMTIFVDGVQRASGKVGPDTDLKSGATVLGKNFIGVLHELRVSSIARYNFDFAPPSLRYEPGKNTLALYHFDEGTGNILRDSSGSNFGGNILGAKWVRRENTQEPPLAVAPLKADQAKQHQRAWADHLDLPVEKEVVLPGGAKMTFMLIPPGEFQMGSSKRELDRLLRDSKPDDQRTNDLFRSEGPQHRVRITRPFYLGKYEVTQSQWQAVMNDNPSANKESLSHPVETVSWAMIQSLPGKLNQNPKQDAGTFKLPTEAQWEYACRAETTTAWHCGDSYAFLLDYAWCNINTEEGTHPVGKLMPNGWNLYDMHGNVREWCADLSDTDYYGHSPANDPSGPANGSDRVLRGGSWRDSATVSRSASRESKHVGYQYANNGFRLAMTIGTSAPTADPNRTAAEWVLSIGGSVETVTGRFENVDQLPKEPFQIISVGLVDNRKVTSGGLQNLEGLTKLTRLDISRSSLGDAGLLHLKGLVNLSYLDLGSSRVGDAEIEDLKGLTNLTYLHFEPNQLTDAGLEQMKGLTKLKSLQLSYAKVSDAGLVHLKGMTNLEVLHLGYNQVRDLKHLAGLTNLTLLHLKASKVDDAGLQHVKGMTKLRSLMLSGTQVSDAGLVHLKGLENLTILYLGDTNVTAQGAADLRKSLPNCNISGP